MTSLTKAQLLTEFSDTVPAGSITPATMRSFINSVPTLLDTNLYAVSQTLANASFLNFTETGGHTGSGIGVTSGNVLQINGDGPGGGTATAISIPLGSTSSQMTFSRPTFIQTGLNPTAVLTPDFRVDNGSKTGTITSGNPFYNTLGTVGDNVNTTGTLGPGADLFYLGFNVGGASMTGNRTTLVPQINVQATTNNHSSNTVFYTASAPLATANVNDNGIMGNGQGNLFAENPYAQLRTGATFWNSIVGAEIDVGVQTGASTSYKIGMKIVQLVDDAVSGTTEDYAFGFNNQASGTAPGWTNGIVFGSQQGWWPMKSTGTMIGTLSSFAGGPGYAAAYGIDFSNITFSSAFLKSTGFSVDPTGITATKSVQATKQYNGSGANALPTASSGLIGTFATVSDGKTSPTAGSAYTAADGAALQPVWCNGTSWLYLM